jgi:hypothetical protein
MHPSNGGDPAVSLATTAPIPSLQSAEHQAALRSRYAQLTARLRNVAGLVFGALMINAWWPRSWLDAVVQRSSIPADIVDTVKTILHVGGMGGLGVIFILTMVWDWKAHTIMDELERISEGRQPAGVSKAKPRPSLFRRLSRPTRARTLDKATLALDVLSALVPKRIATEEIGDALEFIHEMKAKGRPAILVLLKVVTTFWWVTVHTGLHFAERALGIVKAFVGLNKNERK